MTDHLPVSHPQGQRYQRSTSDGPLYGIRELGQMYCQVIQVDCLLQIAPELGRDTQGDAQATGGFRRHSAATTDDPAELGSRDVQLDCERRRGQTEGSHQLV